jgi:transposase-like protein
MARRLGLALSIHSRSACLAARKGSFFRIARTPRCDSHVSPDTWRFKKSDCFERSKGPRRVQRYVCQRCLRNFSSQIFAVDYWLKSPHLLKAVFWGIVNCSGLRQIARASGVHHSTLQRYVERLRRHCLLFHESLRPRCPAETVVLDGFRAVESGRYWPFDLQLLVGVSHYVHGFNEAELLRSGTHKPRQLAKRLRLETRFGHPDPRTPPERPSRKLRRVSSRKGGSVELHSDAHRAYPRAFARVKNRVVRHNATSSKAPERTRTQTQVCDVMRMVGALPGATRMRTHSSSHDGWLPGGSGRAPTTPQSKARGPRNPRLHRSGGRGSRHSADPACV